jgi:nucleoside diphosphate kinase
VKDTNESEKNETLSYIMLKPDGNKPEVFGYIRKVFADNGLPFAPFQVWFTIEQAYSFYPKDDAWKEKYGQKRIDFLKQHGKLKATDQCLPLAAGVEILNAMARYLASGNCCVFLFEKADAAQFGRDLVGATVPVEAAPHTLRGRFSNDTLEAAALEKRALRNVAHAPDDDRVLLELKKISELDFVFEDKRAFIEIVSSLSPSFSSVRG